MRRGKDRIITAGFELEAPALAGRFFTTEPPGKPVAGMDNTYVLF